MQQEIKHFKGENAGRSMIEMLGVLAVIGVLSVGGITGYKLAMNHYAANQIAYEINMLRTDAKVKIAQGAKELTFDEPYNSGHLRYDETYKIGFGFTADSEMSEEDESINGYYVELSDIPKNICKPLANLLNNMSERAEFEGECNQETNNTLYVAFEAENLSGENTETQPEETPEPEAPTPCEQNCEGGYCNKSGECIICGERIWDPDNEKCICPNNGHWNDVRCVSDDECTGGQKWSDEAKGCVCPEGSYLSGDTCVTCTNGEWKDNQCICSEPTPYWDEAAGICKSCSSVGDGSTPVWDSSSKTCKTCYEVYGEAKPKWSGSECVACESGTKWNTQTNTCKKVGECQTNADCNPNGGNIYYCYTSDGYDCSVEFKDGSENTTGECRLVSSDLMEAKINGTTYYGSGKTMTWWSACRLCAARAGQSDSVCASGTSRTTNEPDFMAGYDMLQCADPIRGGESYCHKTQAGNTSYDSANISDVVSQLKEKFGSSYYLWLKNSYSSCSAYYVRLSNGKVDYYPRDTYGGYYALCRDPD